MKMVRIKTFFVPSLSSHHEIKPGSAGNFSSEPRCAFHPSLPAERAHTRLPGAPEKNEWGSLLTLRSGCCRGRHRRDIARCCRLSHTPAKRRREMRSCAPVPSFGTKDQKAGDHRCVLCVDVCEGGDSVLCRTGRQLIRREMCPRL